MKRIYDALAGPPGERDDDEVDPAMPVTATYPIPGRPQEITVSAGTAFKLGYDGAFGAFAASLIPWVLFVLFGGALMAALLHH